MEPEEGEVLVTNNNNSEANILCAYYHIPRLLLTGWVGNLVGCQVKINTKGDFVCR